MKTLVTLAVAAFAITAFGTVSAHPKTYVNVTGDQVIVPTDCDEALGVAQGGVCWQAGHVVQGSTISISDTVTNPTSGFYCSPTCGATPGGGIPFCGSIKTGLAAPVQGQVIVFLDGPVFGNPVTSVCLTASLGTTGTINHT
jgi:hypothetical protein